MSKEADLLKKLVSENIITDKQAKGYMLEAENSKQAVEDVILTNNAIDPEKLYQLKAKLYGLPYINLVEKEIDEPTLNTISSEVAENYRIICFERSGNKIKVGLTQPDNFKAIEAVDFLAKGNNLLAEYYFISGDSFEKAYKQYRSMAKELSSALRTRKEEEAGAVKKIREEDDSEASIEEITKSAPVAKIVSVIIRHAVEGKASDIHVEPSRKETRVRYRIDGVLHTSLVLPINVHASIVARIKVMASLKLDETRIPQDGRIRLVVNDKEIDFRVSILPLVGAEKVVMRILDTTKGPPKLEDLGYQGRHLKVIMEISKMTEGMMLVTGPTGSGKSTTLFSLLSMINKEGVNISTLEDPVEYQMKGVNQSQIRPEIGYTFSSGLRSFLRQDPDIIMVGEIRDEETAELAIHAALTGHFVLSTLHTTDAPGAITRFIDMGIAPFLLGSTLHAIIAQRLARKICEFCREKTEVPQEYKEQVEKAIDEVGVGYIKEISGDFDRTKINFFKGKGCPKCGNTGYKGRTAVSEVLELNSELKEKILNGQKHLSMEEIKKSQKYTTIFQDGIIKVLQGKTTMEEILRVMKN